MRCVNSAVSRDLPTPEGPSTVMRCGWRSSFTRSQVASRRPTSLLRPTNGVVDRCLSPVAEDAAMGEPATVVVNGAEGEPGTLKDRTILRDNPYNVIEGALIAARAVRAGQVIIALKETFVAELERVNGAIDEIRKASWADDVDLYVHRGPREYLYGEETALLESIDGRPPFPRVAPPYRRGVVEVVETPADVDSESGLPAHVDMAVPGGHVEWRGSALAAGRQMETKAGHYADGFHPILAGKLDDHLAILRIQAVR